MQAGRDLAVAGSALASTGDMSLSAGRSASFTTVTNEKHDRYKEVNNGHKNLSSYDAYLSQGSSATAGGNLSVTAGTKEKGHITAVGSRLGSEGTTSLSATGDIVIASAEDREFSSSYHSRKGFLSAKMEASATAYKPRAT